MCYLSVYLQCPGRKKFLMLMITNESIVATALHRLVSVTRNASEPGWGEVPDHEEFYHLLS